MKTEWVNYGQLEPAIDQDFPSYGYYMKQNGLIVVN